MKTDAEVFRRSHKYNTPGSSHNPQWITELWTEREMALSGPSRTEEYVVSEPHSPLTPLEERKFHPFCLWLPTLSHVRLVQSKSELSTTHQHSANCSSAGPSQCCLLPIGGKVLVIWTASPSEALVSHFGRQDWGLWYNRGGFVLSTATASSHLPARTRGPASGGFQTCLFFVLWSPVFILFPVLQ